MANRKKLSLSQKVIKMETVLGGRGAVVRLMGSASRSSLKRWERGACKPIVAHVKAVNEAYEMSQRMENEMSRLLSKERLKWYLKRPKRTKKKNKR